MLDEYIGDLYFVQTEYRKVKRVFWFSIVRDNQARAYRRLARYTAMCGGIRLEKGPSWNSL
jgi:hypothetical protein